MKNNKMPKFDELIVPVFNAVRERGGSATNNELYNTLVTNLQFSDEVVDKTYANSGASVLKDRIHWAVTYLKKYGALENSKRGVYAITSAFSEVSAIGTETVLNSCKKNRNGKASTKEPDTSEEIINEEPWRTELAELLKNMNPYAFEHLTMKVLRECGFDEVTVTKKSGDGGIDGYGKFKINGVFSFKIAFQCKRYKGVVGASEIRDFRGSLTTNIEKGLMITTGTFSRAAKEEASSAGKQQIDLIDGDEFISKMLEFEIGVEKVTAYKVKREEFEPIDKE
ncbi:MAG: restriction endonuclease [Oscillospiraceae bacterium]|jgi:restriction system protein|nr:restriction endonuclease [Oscillospiraceae bacterium]